MKVIISRNSGYCSGVKRALRTLDDAIKNNKNGRIMTLGEIIHNPGVAGSYKNMGVLTVDRIDEVDKNDCLVIRSHGVSPNIIEELNKKEVNVLNATCAFVMKVHKLVKMFDKKGYFIVLIGDEKHPEIIGIKGNITPGNFQIINSPENAETIITHKKIAVLSQTTQTKENLIDISKNILDKIGNEIVILNTTCHAVELRQREASELAGKVDVMVIAGGKNSANTIHLAEISRKIQPCTYHIENEDEIDAGWFKGKKSAGICSGASTPMEDILKIKELIEGF